MDFGELQIKPNPKENKTNLCDGLLYRCRINNFINNSGVYIEKVSFVPLKRMSCKGCEQCGFLIDDLKEFLANETPPIYDNLENGAIYELVVCNVSTDWESGYVDDWELCFKKVEEENNIRTVT